MLLKSKALSYLIESIQVEHSMSFKTAISKLVVVVVVVNFSSCSCHEKNLKGQFTLIFYTALANS